MIGLVTRITFHDTPGEMRVEQKTIVGTVMELKDCTIIIDQEDCVAVHVSVGSIVKLETFADDSDMSREFHEGYARNIAQLETNDLVDLLATRIQDFCADFEEYIDTDTILANIGQRIARNRR